MKINNYCVHDSDDDDSILDDIGDRAITGAGVYRPIERTCSLCGEPLVTRPELSLGICDVCRHDREDLDTETYVPVDVYMGTRGEYEITPQKSASFDDAEFDGYMYSHSPFPEDEDDLSRL